MKERLLELLACPTCGGDIRLAAATRYEENEIIDGILTCRKCDREYKVVRGVPRFADLGKIEEDKAATAENFGWQWTNFTQEDPKYNEQFLGWLRPVRPEFFEDKVVLEGGCGKGRHTKLAAEWGAKDVVGIDLGDGVESAFALTRHMANVHIVQCDIFKLPLKKAFDYAFSVGVLHHTPDPKAAFISLAGKVKKGGHISAWVYGAENNEWITRFIDPVREGFTSQISQPVLYQLSKLPTLGVFLGTKLIYRPLNTIAKPIADKLFYNDYLSHLGTFGWREQHNIVFDHLVAPTAFYIPKEEFAAWWREIDASEVEINWHNQNSWCGFGQVR
ncbi:MAG: methyltransferase domain-containing protein [Acidobacteria bacterium]|nr:methyltransferase domain-containing protein [Acidobacteriota bacterium]MCW5950219.1 methyltransferase domain-containing protein [Pyrinomonadaceae bacterium]